LRNLQSHLPDDRAQVQGQVKTSTDQYDLATLWRACKNASYDIEEEKREGGKLNRTKYKRVNK
jgi:hypothetical protein